MSVLTSFFTKALPAVGRGSVPSSGCMGYGGQRFDMVDRMCGYPIA